MPTISTAEDLAKLAQYTALRDAPRHTMAHGVYPNSLKALTEYQALQAWLTENADYGELHTTTVGAVLPHVQTMITAMQQIIGVMRAIEAAAPGTFNIQLPEADISGE